MSRFLRSATKSLQSLAPIFRPPFDGLIWLVVLYFGWCFLVYPHSQTLRGNLPDPDDYMYLVQVLDWITGSSGLLGGWYDNIQHRINPPEGIIIHFSRLTEIPMALMVIALHKLGLGLRASSMLMAMIYPLMLLGGFLTIMRWMAQSFMPKKWAGVTSYVALFCIGMMFMFMPGHVDHHGLIIALVALTLGCVIRMIDKPAEPPVRDRFKRKLFGFRLKRESLDLSKSRAASSRELRRATDDSALWGLAAGLVMAFGMVVALEILPWLLLIAAWVGLWATVKGGKAALNALAFGLGLHLSSLVFLLITRSPDQWLAPDILIYSVVYVMLTGGIAVSFAGLALAAKAPAWVRWLVGVSLAALTGGLFLHHFPDLTNGPYGGMDPELAQLMLGEVDEAQPLIKLHPSFILLTMYLSNSCMALATGIYSLWYAKDNATRWRWGLLMVVLAASVGLSTFYQYRFMGVMGMSTIIPLAVLLQRGWAHIGTFAPGRKKVFAEIGLLLLVGPLPGVLYPALLDGRSFNTGFLLFPVDAGVTKTPCDIYEIEKILNNPKIYGDHPRLIMNVMGQGPELLFRTPHQVLAAPFLDVSGNVDALRFFSTPYASEAEAIARRRHIDLVIACRYVPDMLTRPPEELAGTLTGGAGKDFAPHFVELLMTNKQPAWLKPVHFPSLHNFVIFEMQPEVAGGKQGAESKR